MEQDRNLTRKLLDLMQETGYPLVQHNGQRKFGPPPDWNGPPPPRGCEVFIGKLPREIYEDELVPIFARVGKIYEFRLMMDFSGSNRGYAFVTYATKVEAVRAVRELDGYEVQPGKQIGVVKSVDNCRLFIGGIPKTKTKEEVLQELSTKVAGIVDVLLYKNCFDRRLNRGFAFVEFTSHRAAAMARRSLVPGCVKLWDQDVMVDWAEPEPYVDDDEMQQVKVLYARNFLIRTTPEMIQIAFEAVINTKVERVKKIYDYAFIHFYERSHAELAMRKLQNAEIDGSSIELTWAKPVDRDLYRVQKMSRGNAKFNNNRLTFSQTMLLYKQHLQKHEYEKPIKEEDSSSNTIPNGEQTDVKPWAVLPSTKQYTIPPAKLESICKRYMWAPPTYTYHKYVDPTGRVLWVGRVELPSVGQPLFSVPQRVGPLYTSPCCSMEEAYIKAADFALYYIKSLKADNLCGTGVTPIQPVFPSMLPSSPTYIRMPYECINQQIYPGTQTLPVPFTRIW